jgi:aminoglycoside phosphotransferase family enzyme
VVFLVGDLVYKLKKPVDLGFLGLQHAGTAAGRVPA